MTAAGNKTVRISALLLASVVMWVGPAGAKTTGDGEAPAKKTKVAARAPAKEPKKKSVEADVIANLDDLGQSGVFEKAEKRDVSEKRARRREARAAQERQSSPGIGDLFRGDDRSAARPEHREVGFVARDRLSSRQVGRVMRAHRDEVAHCFARASRRGAGEVILHLGVAAAGKVTSVKMNVQGASPRRVRRCLASRVRSWRFPAAGAASSIEFPFVFGTE